MTKCFEFRPEKLVYGGDALGHYQGKTVLVPRVLPGEQVEVEPHRTAKGVLHARPRKIVAAAPERIEPPCPYFGRCGGCQYQHFDAQRQTSVKVEILRETLRRLGKIAWEAEIPAHAAEPWHYRNQAQFKVGRAGEGIEIGFFESESHRLFPVDACPILSPRLNAILGELRREGWRQALSYCEEIELLADDRDEQVQMVLRGTFPPPEAEGVAKGALERLPGVVSVTIEEGRRAALFGRKSLTYRVGEFEYQVSPGSFFQSSRFLLTELVRAATDYAPGPLAVDLFCGVGLLTLPLARRFAQVVGVEANSRAIMDLKANAQRHGIDNLRAVGETVEDFLRRWAQPEADLVVLDPPRAGVGLDALKRLAALRPKALHYVSCSPPTLARDLGYLVGEGYRLISVELFDFFPQTYHIESLVRLARSDLVRP